MSRELEIPLSQLKQECIDFIDEKVKELILLGFYYGENVFSMSIEAQINWSNLLSIPESYFPLQINTKEDTVYNLHFSNRDAFYMSAMAHKTSKLGLGTARKQMVVSCNTNQELVDLMDSFVWE